MNDMYRISVTKADVISQPNPDLVQTMIADLMANGPEDFKIAMAAGCSIDFKYENEKVIFHTRYPISILKDDKGNVLSVIEKR